MNPRVNSFFREPVDPEGEGRERGAEAVRRFLIWMAEGRTLEERGLRATVALYCLRPDLIGGATLERIGEKAGRTRQRVHQLADSFRLTTGLSA